MKFEEDVSQIPEHATTAEDVLDRLEQIEKSLHSIKAWALVMQAREAQNDRTV